METTRCSRCWQQVEIVVDIYQDEQWCEPCFERRERFRKSRMGN